MSVFGSSGGRKMNCDEVAPLLVFLACDRSDRGRTRRDRELTSRNARSATRNWLKLANSRTAFATYRNRQMNWIAPARYWRYVVANFPNRWMKMSAPPVEQESWRPFGFVRRWMALRPGLERGGIAGRRRDCGRAAVAVAADQRFQLERPGRQCCQPRRKSATTSWRRWR
jgi:hypothetical protein